MRSKSSPIPLGHKGEALSNLGQISQVISANVFTCTSFCGILFGR